MKPKLLLCILYLLFVSFQVSGENIYKKISAIECDSLIKANEENADFVILDVRTAGEWIPEHLEGSINRSTGDSDFLDQLDILPKHKIYLLHCKSGGRSAGAFAKMQALDFAEVYEMQGGINAWKSGGFPTTAEFAPKLMLVSYTDSLENSVGTDTIDITITNRANDTLKFTSLSFDDLHSITHNFDLDKTLLGAEDYTFSIYHTPEYLDDDSTIVEIDSNGGILKINIVLKNGIIQNTEKELMEELTLYPNPVKDYIYLSNSSFEKLIVYNLSGKIVLARNDIFMQSTIDLSTLKKGIYIIHLKKAGHVFTKKIIIQ